MATSKKYLSLFVTLLAAVLFFVVSFEVAAADTTPPTIDVFHSPGSPTTVDIVTLSASGSDSGSGMAQVEILVDVNKNGVFTDPGENEICTSAGAGTLDCLHSVGFLAADTYQYLAKAKDVAGNVSSTVIKTFTVTPVGTPTPTPASLFVPLPAGPQTGLELLGIINAIANWVFAGFLVLATIFIILAAFQFLTGGGEPAQVSQARTKLMWAAVAIAIAAAAKGIPVAVRHIVGV